MKTRDPRKSVVIPARLRLAHGWRDGRILNISRRGMMIQASQPPASGTYLEVRRGQHVVVARVVWSSSGRFGIRSQDPIDAEGMIRASPPSDVRTETGGPCEERRRVPRAVPARHEASRHKARMVEFCCLALLGLIAALGVWGSIGDLLAEPVAAARAALEGAA